MLVDGATWVECLGLGLRVGERQWGAFHVGGNNNFF
jgi:hypothetical protein